MHGQSDHNRCTPTCVPAADSTPAFFAGSVRVSKHYHHRIFTKAGYPKLMSDVCVTVKYYFALHASDRGLRALFERTCVPEPDNSTNPALVQENLSAEADALGMAERACDRGLRALFERTCVPEPDNSTNPAWANAIPGQGILSAEADALGMAERASGGGVRSKRRGGEFVGKLRCRKRKGARESAFPILSPIWVS
jgi:hypothetical protein